jgi:hypothetical protein
MNRRNGNWLTPSINQLTATTAAVRAALSGYRSINALLRCVGHPQGTIRHFPFAFSPASHASRVRFEAFVVLLEFWLGLTVRYRLSRHHRIESPSIGFVRNLLLGGSLRFDNLLFAFSPREGFGYPPKSDGFL